MMLRMTWRCKVPRHQQLLKVTLHFRNILSSAPKRLGYQIWMWVTIFKMYFHVVSWSHVCCGHSWSGSCNELQLIYVQSCIASNSSTWSPKHAVDVQVRRNVWYLIMTDQGMTSTVINDASWGTVNWESIRYGILTHWPLGDMRKILKITFLMQFLQVMSSAISVEFTSYRIPRNTS